jgi:hypothetical protein
MPNYAHEVLDDVAPHPLRKGWHTPVQTPYVFVDTCAQIWGDTDYAGLHEYGRYEERCEANDISTVVVLKSIVSGGCTVATNLLDLLVRSKLEVVYIAALLLIAVPARTSAGPSRQKSRAPSDTLCSLRTERDPRMATSCRASAAASTNCSVWAMQRPRTDTGPRFCRPAGRRCMRPRVEG